MSPDASNKDPEKAKLTFNEDAHYGLIRQLHQVLDTLSMQLPFEIVSLLDEMINAREGEVALETIIDIIVEDNLQTERSLFKDISLLVERMGMETGIVEQIKPFVID